MLLTRVDKTSDERLLAVVARHTNFALRFAMILSAARSGKYGVIAGEDLFDGMKLAENYLLVVPQVWEICDMARVTGEQLRKVFKAVQTLQGATEPDRVPTMRNVGRYAHVSNAQARLSLDELRRRGCVTVLKEGRAQLIIPLVAELPVRL